MSSGLIMFAVPERKEGEGARAGQLRRIERVLVDRGFEVRRASTAHDALAVLRTEAGMVAAVVDWDLPKADTDGGEPGGADVLRQADGRFRNLPVFLVTDGDDLQHLPLWVAESVIGYIWPLEDTAAFIAGRIVTASRTYEEDLLPPFFKALRRFDDAHEYSWHTPAHAGGVGFLKSPVGRAFHDYFGERILRSDLSISVEELGSLFEHSGAVGDAEANAARIFGADRTYFVLHGDSTCDRMVGHFSVTRDEIALVDRNCHKSVLHGLVLSGARPVYLIPTRNGYGLAGPLPPGGIEATAIASRIAANPLTGDRPDWFFGVWQPETVTDPATGDRVPFAEAPPALLGTHPSCRELEPGADWHGFDGLSQGYCLLDPVKVTLTCPGIDARGSMAPGRGAVTRVRRRRGVRASHSV
ncbi:Orn/Lys/Arg decarboxylase N-terminal domain-containing protein [Streptomyces sp. BE230]|uniref:Orn/Lys/Arg decarboxylase N-terminal domain-containing protein n=1 Tax=Streptomyces sp. BE230 TaxID=3002526 RepID=UPI002ED44A07|nr:Orn/Lys/Arg decarboxylase N-terminal domain-containing protein [Streptomyces sp. BE230]